MEAPSPRSGGSEALDSPPSTSRCSATAATASSRSIPAAKIYRDARINRIFEGTNEINRLLIPGTLLRRAMKGRLDLLGAARRAQEALLAPSSDEAGDGPLAAQAAQVDAARQVTLLVAGAAVQRFGTAIEEQQEVLAAVADLVIQTAAMDSAVARARQAGAAAGKAAAIHADLATLFVAERLAQVEAIARAITPTVADGDDARLLQSGIRRLLRTEPLDQVAIGRRIAASIVAAAATPSERSGRGTRESASTVPRMFVPSSSPWRVDFDRAPALIATWVIDLPRHDAPGA